MRISDWSSDVCSSDLIFSNNCATCHGTSAQGAIGFPNLSDDIWPWGGSPEDILTSILDGREGVMPEWGTVLTGMGGDRWEEGGVGKECVSTCMIRWSPDH